jgi:hypothetical protein
VSKAYVVHNARNDVGVDDKWVVVDTTEDTAISLRRTRREAEEDAAIATAFYKRWPNGQPTLSAYIPEGVDEQGGFVDLWEPLLSPGFWSDYSFGDS